jgi:hypothetical protein
MFRFGLVVVTEPGGVGGLSGVSAAVRGGTNVAPPQPSSLMRVNRACDAGAWLTRWYPHRVALQIGQDARDVLGIGIGFGE